MVSDEFLSTLDEDSQAFVRNNPLKGPRDEYIVQGKHVYGIFSRLMKANEVIIEIGADEKWEKDMNKKNLPKTQIQPTKEAQPKQAWLTGISRGMGGDNAEYEGRVPDGRTEKITVCVGWAMLSKFSTYVMVDGALVKKFTSDNGYQRYLQPAEALSLLGYEVHGTVDFAGIYDEKIEDWKDDAYIRLRGKSFQYDPQKTDVQKWILAARSALDELEHYASSLDLNSSFVKDARFYIMGDETTKEIFAYVVTRDKP